MYDLVLTLVGLLGAVLVLLTVVPAALRCLGLLIFIIFSKCCLLLRLLCIRCGSACGRLLGKGVGAFNAVTTAEASSLARSLLSGTVTCAGETAITAAE